MNDHDTRIADGRLYVEDVEREGWLDVGSMADIYAVVGGETFEVEYGDHEAAYGSPWLDTDEDNVLSIDVRETLADMSFPTTFVEELADRPLDDAEIPDRTDYFADAMVRVWESRGNLPEDENPFI